jgi:aryl-alcohol dehydrogenase-like predicted oxidoreductase
MLPLLAGRLFKPGQVIRARGAEGERIAHYCRTDGMLKSLYTGKIGGTGLISSPIGLGCVAFTGSYGRVEEAETVRRIRQALDLGVSLLDMADFYRAGEIERLAGRAVGSRRDEAVIATQGGLQFDATGRLNGIDATPDQLRKACEASLMRLGMEHIDLYYLACADPDVPIEDSVGQLAELAAAGKIRQIGLVTSSAQQLRRAHRVHPVAAVCTEYSLWERRAEAECLPAARELGVTLVACRPLGRGVLTGQISSPDCYDAADVRHGDSRFSRENLLRTQGLVEEAEKIAASLHIGLSRLALAWLLAQPGVVPIPSTRNPLHLEMNAAAVGLSVPRDHYDRLAALFPRTAFDERR